LKEQLQAENRYLMEEIKSQHNYARMVGQGPAIEHIHSQIDHVARTDSSVLIQGESGTGKELIARSIHDASHRRDRPLVKVNCGAIAPTLVESELFGHEKGAFTGAVKKRIGRFELADGGTIFLDEVGELPLDIQVKLLRVLQEGEFERLGSSETRRVDVRVIAATNRNMSDMLARGDFRDDLYYRLSVFPIHAPSLRQRKEDIPLLVEHILNGLSFRLSKNFTHVSPAVLQQLCDYDWPGNIRELQNVMERAAIICSPPVLDVAPIPSHDNKRREIAASTIVTMREAEAEHIRKALMRTKGVIAGKQGAAELLDLPPSTLRSRMKKLGITI
jgi:transcriptional regulator with GAF, ATPase, and Fis domain